MSYHRRFNYWLAVVLILVLSIVATSCSQAPAVVQEELIPVQFGASNTALPPALAHFTSIPQALGYWEEEGLDVELVVYDGSSASLQALDNGNVLATMDATSSMMAADVAGADLLVYYSESTRNFWMAVVPADSEIQELSELRGKNIGVPSLESATVPIIRTLLSREGVAEGEYELLPIGRGPSEIAALEAGQVDAIMSFDAAVAELRARGVELRELTTPLSERLGFMQGIVTRREAIEEQRDLLVKLARGIAKGIVFAHANPEAAVQIHWEVFPETKITDVSDEEALTRGIAVLESRLENIEPINGQFGFSTEEQITEYISVLVEAGLLDSALDVDQVWTPELVEEINNFDAAAIEEQARNYGN